MEVRPILVISEPYALNKKRKNPDTITESTRSKEGKSTASILPKRRGRPVKLWDLVKADAISIGEVVICQYKQIRVKGVITDNATIACNGREYQSVTSWFKGCTGQSTLSIKPWTHCRIESTNESMSAIKENLRRHRKKTERRDLISYLMTNQELRLTVLHPIADNSRTLQSFRINLPLNARVSDLIEHVMTRLNTGRTMHAWINSVGSSGLLTPKRIILESVATSELDNLSVEFS